MLPVAAARSNDATGSIRGVGEAAEPLHGLRAPVDLPGDAGGDLLQPCGVEGLSALGQAEQVVQQAGILADDRQDVPHFVADVGADAAEKRQVLLAKTALSIFIH